MPTTSVAAIPGGASDNPASREVQEVAAHGHAIFRCPTGEHIMHIGSERSCVMILLDAPMVLAMAALIGSISSLVWALRRSR